MMDLGALTLATQPGASLLDAITFRAGHNTSIVLLGTIVLGIAAGVVGPFAMLRRRSLMADALSHATLPGICIAFMVASAIGVDGRSLAILLPGAAISGIIGLLVVHWATRATRLTEDAAIGAVLSVFFGIGVVLLSVIQEQRSGNQGGLKGLIFGQTATMHASDAVLMGLVAIAVTCVAAVCFKHLALVCFNDEFAATIGVPVRALDLLLMAMVVLITVVGLVAVGMVLVVALLIIPAAAARLWTDRLRRMVLLSALFGGVSALAGTLASSTLDRTPTGPAIVLSAGFIFLVGMVAAPRRGVVAGILRQFGVRVRIHADHALAAMLRSVSDPRPVSSVLPPGLVGVVVGATLQRRSLARIEGGMIALTPEGIAAAELADRRRRLWERYLVSYADIAPSHVDISADAIEHVVDPQIVASLESELAAEINGHARVATARHVPDGGAP
jgi:manganese/zinc/iron transport system permease protein